MSVSTSIFVDISNHNMNITDIGHVVHRLIQKINIANTVGNVGGFATIHSYDFQSFVIVFNTESGKRSVFMCTVSQKEEIDGLVYDGDKVYISLGHNQEGIRIMKMVAESLVQEFDDLPVFFRESNSFYHENNEWVQVK
ncbi:hypothetical protein [Aeromonas phage AS-yj]|uniref:Uncharacterized protein n=4 Tax=Ceceduovirus TaxID=2842588 RepID=A0A291LE77_9CAUD|nr:hypothetical protein HWB28_gp293 [Aeromonas phage AS-zj]YP_009834826.1 hypothetical protein HWB29_gp124 [Aeromonas phage AS-sw]ATI17335.1 hypothetical protein [Aeromonas phage AS-szw]ATI17759.1 hypothetical protein [Aeromonas phage AS-yj]ASU00259.1 hypothetical protein [Aeromonas phage AS-zj]ATI18174.1 hypothetical protein [Aeromonas phage AS-sw]